VVQAVVLQATALVFLEALQEVALLEVVLPEVVLVVMAQLELVL
jgi:hypothetical protein